MRNAYGTDTGDAEYMDIKKDYPDAILFFRLGDFYEMFLRMPSSLQKR